MQKKWFYRLLLSYLPIFLAITSLLWFISALTISELSKKASEQANEASASHAMQLLDASLRSVDEAVLKELRSNGVLAQFFYPPEEGTTFNTLYEPSNLLRGLITGIQSIRIDSIYVYRNADGAVLSSNSMLPLDQSGDGEFIGHLLEDNGEYAKVWSDVRSYQEFKGKGSAAEVVSLVRKVPVISGGKGFIVVNIQTSQISQLIENVMSSDYTYVSLRDDKGSQVFRDSPRFSESQAILNDPRAAVVHSGYTGWELQSGLKYMGLFNVISGFTKVLLTAGGIAIVIGIVGIVVITRRNYSPIESVLMRLQHVSHEKMLDLLPQSGKDEFKFIENALDNLMEQSIRYRERQKEDLIYRRQYFFEQLMEGSRIMDEKEWRDQMAQLVLPVQFTELQVIIVEVDRYLQFVREYSHRDQYLLKFVLSSIVRELIPGEEAHIWAEWLNDRQMTVLYQWQPEAGHDVNAVRAAERLLEWVAGNLKFTVTVGIGGEYASLQEVPESYVEALEAIKYKTVFGTGQIITHDKIADVSQGEVFTYLQLIRSLSQKFRLGDPEWLQQFESLFESLQDMLFSREDLVSIGNYLIYHLRREMGELASEARDIWEDAAMNRLHEVLEQFDTAVELYHAFREILMDTAERLSCLRESKRNYHQIREIKEYIEQSFDNPDLCLTHLGDKFGMSSKYISQLFKDEFGVNFVDYVTGVRMEHAKKMLLETELSVKEVAASAGYLHSFSFIRVFKKVVGITPGDFRKNSAVSEE